MNCQIKLLSIFLTVTLLNGCSENSKIPSYLKDYEKEYQDNPKEANLTWFKNAGMKYITITSKHHDGFCLFVMKATDFNVLNSPAKRDLIKELYNA